MKFYTGVIPQGHQTENFTFRPLTPQYVEWDYDALMASKPILRQWSHSPWPQDDFTLDANRTDLQRHLDEWENGEAYSFTVLNPQETRVEGCLYIYPLLLYLNHFGASPDQIAQVTPHDARVGFWIRQDRLADEALLFNDILTWLSQAWQFPAISYGTYDSNQRQTKLFESLGMQARFRLPQPDGVTLCFYHMPDVSK